MKNAPWFSFVLILFLSACSQNSKKSADFEARRKNFHPVIYDKDNIIRSSGKIEGKEYTTTSMIRAPGLNKKSHASIVARKEVCIDLAFSGREPLSHYKKWTFNLFINGEFEKEMAIGKLREIKSSKIKSPFRVYDGMVCSANEISKTPKALGLRIINQNKKPFLEITWENKN